MITTPTRSSPPWPAIIGFLVGMAGVAGSITVVFLGMRSVLDVGGQCASGGPYVIGVPCPDGTWTLPLAVFAGLGFVFLAVAGGTKIGGIYAQLPGLAWTGLFCSLGLNFLQWGIAPPSDPSVDSSGGGLIFVGLGLMFEVMGIVPLATTLWAMRPGATKPSFSFGGRSFTTDDLKGASDPLRTDDSTAAGTLFETSVQAPFAAMASGKNVDMNELLSEVAKTVAEARAKGIAGPMVMTQAGLTSLNGLAGATGAAGGTGGDLVAELERLTALHQAGNLTDEEFATAKQNLLKEHA
ncbi:MAG TPA: SHOCT domain-containing protein [Candidatus Limnocylindrales bacterium]|nr:SHOCT domain-containing protein [Candidatus Limnocylindrales bacterium]